jgi:cell division protease FtsH
VPFISVSGTEFVESLVGVGAARVRDLFAQVRAVAPAICFVDEIDAVGRRREGEGVSGGEREQTLNQLLVEMDGFEVTSGIVVIGATNRPDILDPALLRPGRFDRHVTLEVPDRDGREAILRVHARNRPLSPDVDFSLLARRTAGFTGADLANVLNEAALLVVRKGTPGAQIGPDVLSEAVQRVLHGPHRGTIMSPAERTRIATHEAGHAVVATAVGRGEELNRVSIMARGKGLGSSSLSADGDRVLLTASDLAAQLATAMAGKAAEGVVFGDSSTTATDDIERASALARQMVGLYGMGEGVGPVRLLESAGGYLGGQPVPSEAVSEATLAAFDAEVRRLVTDAERQAGEIVAANRPALDAMVAALQENEALEGSALESLLAQVHTGGNGTSGGALRKLARRRA